MISRVAIVLITACLLACRQPLLPTAGPGEIPTRRVLRIDPMVALREE
jgi:hypothetical protein